jgi:hypothetical protein
MSAPHEKKIEKKTAAKKRIAIDEGPYFTDLGIWLLNSANPLN